MRGTSDDAAGMTDHYDPLVYTGIILSGAGAALIATLGAVGAAIMTVGLVTMAVGFVRSRKGSD